MKTPKTKVCTKCGKRKKLEKFSIDKKCSCGKTNHCKKCKSDYDKLYREINKKRLMLKSRTYYKANKEQTAIKSKVYRESHKEQLEVHRKRYYKANKEVLCARSKLRRDAKPEKYRIIHQAYYRKNTAKVKKSVKRYRTENPEKCRQREKKWREHLTNKQKQTIKTRKQLDQKRAIIELRNSYIKAKLCRDSGLFSDDIPQELIEAKREHIKLTRKLRSST